MLDRMKYLYLPTQQALLAASIKHILAKCQTGVKEGEQAAEDTESVKYEVTFRDRKEYLFDEAANLTPSQLCQRC